MEKVFLLDCTLQDGGYVNDLEFDHDALVNVFKRLVSTHIKVNKIGFLDKHLLPEIVVGGHAHNNFQVVYRSLSNFRFAGKQQFHLEQHILGRRIPGNDRCDD